VNENKNLPAKRFKSSGVEVSVWKNEGKEGSVFFTVSLQRSYKDKEGNWQSTASLRKSDLLVASHLLEKAYDFIDEQSGSGNSDNVEELVP